MQQTITRNNDDQRLGLRTHNVHGKVLNLATNDYTCEMNHVIIYCGMGMDCPYPLENMKQCDSYYDCGKHYLDDMMSQNTIHSVLM